MERRRMPEPLPSVPIDDPNLLAWWIDPRLQGNARFILKSDPALQQVDPQDAAVADMSEKMSEVFNEF
eukprot:3073070-Prymnesium_polylepis.1